MNSFLVGGAIGVAMAMSALPAAAATVVYQNSGTTDWLDVWDDLPGAGTYTFEFTSSVPVEYTLWTSYTYHWDVFVAPAPQPHSANIEGNENPVETTKSDVASTFSWTFVVPEMTRSFFTAGSEYEAFGIVSGTELYLENKYENPYFEFSAYNASGEEFGYDFKITHISAVPEPAAWALMIVGFGAVGSMLRASRRRVSLSLA